MVLGSQGPGRVGRRRFLITEPPSGAALLRSARRERRRSRGATTGVGAGYRPRRTAPDARSRDRGVSAAAPRGAGAQAAPERGRGTAAALAPRHLPVGKAGTRARHRSRTAGGSPTVTASPGAHARAPLAAPSRRRSRPPGSERRSRGQRRPARARRAAERPLSSPTHDGERRPDQDSNRTCVRQARRGAGRIVTRHPRWTCRRGHLALQSRKPRASMQRELQARGLRRPAPTVSGGRPRADAKRHLRALSPRPQPADDPSASHASSLARTRFTTSSVTCVVDACPPRSGVRTPAAVASITDS